MKDTVATRVDPARRRAYETLIARVRRSEGDEARGFDSYWEAVGEILDRGLFADGGYDSAEAFLAREVKVPRRSAMRMVRVARYASPVEEQKYGVAVLDAALGYVEAKAGGAVKGRLPVDWNALRVPVVREGKAHHARLGQVTVVELRAATRALTNKGKALVTRAPAERAIVEALGGVKSLAGVSVHVSDGQVRLGGVPLYALADLARVLRTVPVDAGAKGSVGRATKTKRVGTKG